MKTFKKLLSLFLVCFILASICPSVLSEESEPETEERISATPSPTEKPVEKISESEVTITSEPTTASYTPEPVESSDSEPEEVPEITEVPSDLPVDPTLTPTVNDSEPVTSNENTENSDTELPEEAISEDSSPATEAPFEPCYAVVSSGTTVYSDVRKHIENGVFTEDSIVYVTELADAQPDVLKILFVDNGNDENGYISASNVHLLDDTTAEKKLSSFSVLISTNGIHLPPAAYYSESRNSDEPVPESTEEPLPDLPSEPLSEPDVENRDTESITVSSVTDNTEIPSGYTLQLTARINASEPLSNHDIIWSSSNEAVATVSSSGVVTAKKVNETTMVSVRATSAVDASLTGTISLYVYPIATSIVIKDSTGTSIVDGQHIKFEYGVNFFYEYTVNIQPEVVNDDWVFTTSDASVADIKDFHNGTFRIEAHNPGSCVISVGSYDGYISTRINVSVQTTIENLSTNYITKDGVVYVAKGKTVSIKDLIVPLPEEVTNTNYVYSTAGKNIATVSADGKVKGIAVGSTTITAKSSDGSDKNTAVKVKVISPTTKLTVTKTSDMIVGLGKTYIVRGAVSPAASANCLVLTSSDESIIRPVTGFYDAAAGGFKIESVNYGSALIRISATDGSGKSATMRITVAKSPDGIRLSIPADPKFNIGSEWELGTGKKVTLRAEVIGEDVCKDIVWSSSNTSVATVSSTGVVTAKKTYGTAVITAASAANGKINATAKITVKAPVSSIKIKNGMTGSVITTHTFNLDTYTPSNALPVIAASSPAYASEHYAWSSSNEKVAVISDRGFVTPVACGTAKITAKTLDGSGKSASLTITVKQSTSDLTGINVPGNSKYLGVGKTLTLSVGRIPENSTTILDWTTNPSGYISVSNGTIKGIKSSSENPITVTASIPGTDISVSTELIVTPAVAGLKLACVGDGFIDLSTAEKTEQLTVSATDGSKLPVDIVEWVSSDSDIAQVDRNGLVSTDGTKTGSVKITAKATDGSGKSASYTINVGYGITSIDDLPDVINIAVNKTYQLQPLLSPANATVGLNYISASTRIATISKGKITGKRIGKTIITVTPAIGSTAAPRTITVNVTAAATSVSLYLNGTAVASKSVQYLYRIGSTMSLAAKLKPSTAHQGVIWTSSNEDIASVDENGIVTAKDYGVATIKATSVDGTNKSAYITLKIGEPVDHMYITGAHAVVKGTSVALKAYPMPYDAVNKSITWSSSNKKVATVSTTGKVTGVAVGTAVITAKATGTDGEPVVCEYVVNVVNKASSVAIYAYGKQVNNTTQYIDLQWNSPTLQLTHIVNPLGSEQLVSWSSSNTSVATVNANGVVTALKEGTVTIKATASDTSKKSASVKITVVNAGFALKVDCETDVLVPGSSVKLHPITQSSYSSDALLSTDWISSNESILTVSEEGTVTAHAVGKATITAISNIKDGVSAQYDVTVRQPLSDLYITGYTQAVDINNPDEQNLQLTAELLPTTATCPLRWESSDPNIATVDQNGLVSILKKGSCTITAAALDGSGMIAAETIEIIGCVQTVTVLNEGYSILYPGESTQLSVELFPDDDNVGVTWSCDTEGILINEDGLLTVSANYTGNNDIVVTATACDDRMAIGTYTMTATTVSGAGIIYSISDGSAKITGYNGKGGYVRIPEVIDGYTVTVIGSSAFPSSETAITSQITAIDFPQGVDFEAGAVLGLKHLFAGDFIIFNGVLCNYTGKNNSRVEIPDTVRVIGRSSFRDNKTVVSISIPNHISLIMEDAFRGCTNLNTMTCY